MSMAIGMPVHQRSSVRTMGKEIPSKERPRAEEQQRQLHMNVCRVATEVDDEALANGRLEPCDDGDGDPDGGYTRSSTVEDCCMLRPPA